MTPESPVKSAALFKPWRIALVLYAIALTVGTHWPTLEMGTKEHPAPDKIIHLLAFAGLTALLWRTRWLRCAWQVAVVAAAWTAIDELTQALPGLGRTVSYHDLLAGELGVIAVIIWGWALRPVGGEANRMRLRLQSLVVDRAFCRTSAWLFVLIATVPCAVALIFAWPFLQFTFQKIGSALALSFGVSAWLAGAAAIWFGLWRRTFKDVLGARSCSMCGTSCAEAEIDGDGLGQCPGCAAPFHAGQWLAPVGPPSDRMARMMRWPLISTTVIFVLVVWSAYHAIIRMGAPAFLGGQLLRDWPMDLKIAADMAILASIAAVGVLAYRKRLARFHDEQGAVCRGCEHDLRATPVANGIGVCGECGAPFVRLGTLSDDAVVNDA